MSIKQRKTLGKPHNIFYYVFITHARIHPPLFLSGSEVPSFHRPFDGGCQDILPFPTPTWSQQTPMTTASTAHEVPYKLPLLPSPSHTPGTSHAGECTSCLVTSSCDMEVPRFQVSILTQSHTESCTPSPASAQDPQPRGICCQGQALQAGGRAALGSVPLPAWGQVRPQQELCLPTTTHLTALLLLTGNKHRRL